MNYSKILFTLALGFIILLSSCGNDNKTKKYVSTKKEVKKTSIKIPVFNGDTAYTNVKNQVGFGVRGNGTEGHKKIKKWAVDKFNSYGIGNIDIQKFKANFANGQKEDAYNIIAHFNPGRSKKIIIAAHYDTRFIAEKDKNLEMRDKPIDGADDGASGVGVIFELARIVSENKLDLSIDFILFDAEDNGTTEAGDKSWCLGSQYWAENAARTGYKADFGILLDLVGAKGAVFTKEAISKRFAGPIQNVIWNLASNMGYSDLFANIERGNVDDDHLYVNTIARISMVDIISIPDPIKGFGSHHHTHQDNIDIIDMNTLRRTGQVLTAFIYKYSADQL